MSENYVELGATFLLKMIDAFFALFQDVRDHANEPRVHASPFADKDRFNKVCSAMDTALTAARDTLREREVLNWN